MNYFPSPTISNIQAGVAYPQYLSGNVASFGAVALGNLGASVSSYERSIARLKAKISNLKKKRKLVKNKQRKNFINTKILANQKKLKKLQSYLSIKLKNKKKKSQGKKVKEPVFEDEELLLTDAVLPDDDEIITSDEMIGDFEEDKPNLLPFIIGGVALLGVSLLFMSKKPRQNRLKIGKKSNPKRKKRRSKKRRKNRKNGR